MKSVLKVPSLSSVSHNLQKIYQEADRKPSDDTQDYQLMDPVCIKEVRIQDT